MFVNILTISSITILISLWWTQDRIGEYFKRILPFYLGETYLMNCPICLSVWVVTIVTIIIYYDNPGIEMIKAGWISTLLSRIGIQYLTK